MFYIAVLKNNKFISRKVSNQEKNSFACAPYYSPLLAMSLSKQTNSKCVSNSIDFSELMSSSEELNKNSKTPFLRSFQEENPTKSKSGFHNMKNEKNMKIHLRNIKESFSFVTHSPLLNGEIKTLNSL